MKRVAFCLFLAFGYKICENSFNRSREVFCVGTLGEGLGTPWRRPFQNGKKL